MQAIGTWRSGFETVLDDGHTHSVTVDFPVDEGGKSAGPTALELGVMALAGCITSIFALVAKKRRLEFQGMTIALEAERPHGAPTITRVRGTLRIRTRADPSAVKTALEVTLRTCPLGVLFEKAGIPVEVTPIVVAPAHAAASA
jgi:putative redox protein